jgi:hypothetical protein
LLRDYHAKHGRHEEARRWHTCSAERQNELCAAEVERNNVTPKDTFEPHDLDDQLFVTFARSRDLLRWEPVQAADRTDLREKLKVASGGVVFTTIRKFFPEERGDPIRRFRNGATS